MKDRNDAERREALSRALRGQSGAGKRNGGPRAGAGRRFGVLWILAVLAGLGALSLWRFAGNGSSVSVSVSDRSAQQHGKQKEETPGQDPAAEQPSYAVPETVRVVLTDSSFSTVFHDRLILSGDSGQTELTPERLLNAFPEVQSLLSQDGIRFEREGEKYTAERAAGTIGIPSITRSCGTPAYRGSLEIRIREEGLVVINELSLEEYLYGVLPSEMPADYQAEALKAQAVCARTYACAAMQQPRYPDYDAQLDDSTSCQVYGNLAENENTTKAVDATRGEILVYDGRPVSTYYYSTSCGLGSDIGVWQGFDTADYPYLSCRSLNAEHQPVNLSDNTEFASYLAEAHGDIESGHPWYRWHCSVSDVDAELIYGKLKERYAVKREGVELLSNGEAAPAGEKTEPEELPHPGRIRSLSVGKRNEAGCVVCLYIEGENCSYRVWGEYNVRYLLCSGPVTVVRQDGSEAVMNKILPSAYLIFTPSLDNGYVIGYSISGGGYGHGVGMSQNGADALAAEGKDYREILGYYYIGTELEIPE